MINPNVDEQISFQNFKFDDDFSSYSYMPPSTINNIDVLDLGRKVKEDSSSSKSTLGAASYSEMSFGNLNDGQKIENNTDEDTINNIKTTSSLNFTLNPKIETKPFFDLMDDDPFTSKPSAQTEIGFYILFYLSFLKPRLNVGIEKFRKISLILTSSQVSANAQMSPLFTDTIIQGVLRFFGIFKVLCILNAIWSCDI
jgi:hypothetical protein